MSPAPNRNRRWRQNRCPSSRRPCEGPMDRAAVPSAANRRRRTRRPSMKWQRTRSPFAFSSPRPLRLTLYSRRGASSDGDRFATPRRKMGVTAVDMPLVKIGKAAELLGVSVQTLRKREDSGELVPDQRSEGGVRYYDMGKILGLGSEDMPTIGYARVSSHDQKMRRSGAFVNSAGRAEFRLTSCASSWPIFSFMTLRCPATRLSN